MQHIGFIMDGNRTWAKENGLPSFEGHRRGYERAKDLLLEVKKRGIPFASFWALSDDNIKKRDPKEVSFLFDLLSRGILDLAKEADAHNIRIVCIGERSLLPEKCIKNILKAETLTQNNTAMTAIIAIAYGGQSEIIHAIQRVVSSGKDITTLSKEDFEPFLESSVYPPPDLIIRTGGHMRHSGFFLYQSAYSEYFFSQLNWPDFSEEELDRAIESFESSQRKFGK